MKSHYEPGTGLHAFHILTYLFLTTVLGHGFYYPHFTDEETEAETD